MEKVELAVKTAQNKIADIEKQQAKVKSELEKAEAALAAAEANLENALAESGLGGKADLDTVKRQYEIARTNTLRLQAASRKLAREYSAATEALVAAQKAAEQEFVDGLDKEVGEIYAATTMALSGLWNKFAELHDTNALRRYDAAHARFGLQMRYHHLLRTLFGTTRDVHHMLKMLEHADEAEYKAAGGVSEKERTDRLLKQMVLW